MKGGRFASKRGRILHNGRGERHQRKALAHLAREAGARPIRGPRGQVIAHILRDGFVACEKRRYPDAETAQAELDGVRAFGHLQQGKMPVRAYPCGLCRGWHVTSRH